MSHSNIIKYISWAIVLLTAVACSDSKTPIQSFDSFTESELGLLQRINLHRRSIGRAPLSPKAAVGPIARRHSSNMLQKLVPFGHQGFEQRIRELGHAGTENVAQLHYSLAPIESTFEGWLQSPGHRNSMESAMCNSAGVGIESHQERGHFVTFICLFDR